MKKLAALLILCLLFALPALADVDLSGMTYDELLQLRADVDAALWNSDGWQEVEIPVGYYIVGVDIPAGKWSVKSKSDLGKVQIYENKAAFEEDHMYGYIKCDTLHPDGVCNIDFSDGEYVMIEYDNAIFMPYTGAALGFK